MNTSRSSHGLVARRRFAWALFWVVALVGVGASLIAALDTGNRSTVSVTLLGGLVVDAIAALLMGSMLSPLPESYAHRGAGSVGAAAVGGSDGGGSGGGDCGGAGGGCN